MKKDRLFLLFFTSCCLYPSAEAQTCIGTGTKNILVENCSVIHTPSEALVTITPNPAIDFIIVKNAGQVLHFHLFDLLGHKIYTKNLAAESALSIDTRQIPAGIYVAVGQVAPFKKTYVVRIEIFK